MFIIYFEGRIVAELEGEEFEDESTKEEVVNFQVNNALHDAVLAYVAEQTNMSEFEVEELIAA